MEDENGLELSLGLSCGGSSVKSKGKNGVPSDTRAEEVDRGNSFTDDFKNFLHPGTQKHDSSMDSQRSDPVKPQENLFSNFPKAAVEADASMNLNGRGQFNAKNNRSPEVEEEKRPELGNKYKILFDEVNHQKKHEREAHRADLHEKARTSHISITTEDGSTAENEDVAESEADVSTSRLASQSDDGGSSEVAKEVHGVTDSSAVDLQGQKRFNVSSENEFKRNMTYCVPFSVQSVNINVPISKYQQFHPPYAGKGPSNSDKHNDGLKMSQAAGQAIPHNSSEASHYDGRALELTKGEGKQYPIEEGSSCQTEDDVKGNNIIFRSKDGTDQATTEAFSFESPAIRPGIAADLKFGGSGSHPNLPWVSTTGPGPNGKTISGVTYRYSRDQIKIVCACHGSHMSPEEFVQHASEENADPETGAGSAPFPNSNPATSAQS